MTDYSETRTFTFGRVVRGEDIAQIVADHDLYGWKLDIHRSQLFDMFGYVVTFSKEEEEE